MKKIALVLLLALVPTLVFAQEQAQEDVPEDVTRNIEPFFSSNEITTLEELVELSLGNSPSVLSAEVELERGQRDVEALGRFANSLDVNAGAGFEGDFYGQVSPSYSISVGLDVIELIDVDDQRVILDRQLAQARANTRVQVTQSFVNYKNAVQAAESAAFALETSERLFRVTEARVAVGDATATDLVQAQQSVGDAALALAQANGNTIVALEQLAANVGVPVTTVRDLVQ